MSLGSFDPEKADNHPMIEAQWAMAAMHHAETYMGLLKARDPKDLRLTAYGRAGERARRTDANGR